MKSTLHPLLLGILVSSSTALGASITSIEVGPSDAGNDPSMANVLNPASTTFSMHDHVYLSPNVPDPARAFARYHFDGPVIVTGMELGMHANGIFRIEGFIGDTVGSLVSIGIATGSLGNGPYSEHSINQFSFSGSGSGSIFEFVVRETSLENGWANYHAIPEFRDAVPSTVPEGGPGAAGLMALVGIAACGANRRRLG